MQNNTVIANQLVEFMYFCNQLKLELRHCWFEGGRRESVAEHSWQLALLAVTVVPHLSISVSLEKLLKMALVHDLVEIEAKDVPLPTATGDGQEKFEREAKAIINIKNMLSQPLGQEFYDLWHEYESRETDTANVLKALDRMEAFMAHNVSDIETFLEVEKAMYYDDKWLIDLCKIDPILLEMAIIVNRDGKDKVAGNSHTAA